MNPKDWKWIAEQAEELRRVKEIADQSELVRTIREFQRLGQMPSALAGAIADQHTFIASNREYFELLAAAKASLKTGEAVARAVQDLRETIRPFVDLGAEFKRQTEPVRMLARELNQAAARVSAPFERIRDTIAALQVSFARTAESMSREILANQISFANSYLEFSSSQLPKLAGQHIFQARLAEALILRADSMYHRSMEAEGLVDQTVCPSPVIIPIRKHNLFREVKRHANPLYREDRKEEPDDLVSDLLPVQIQEKGTLILELVYEINKTAELNLSCQIFPPTNAWLPISRNLTRVIATGEEEFARITDSLFSLLYEASNQNKRLKGFVEEVHLQVITNLASVRHDFRHDLSQDKDPEKKWARTGAAYQALTGMRWPGTTRQWKLAQLRLYEKIIPVLTDLLASLQKRISN